MNEDTAAPLAVADHDLDFPSSNEIAFSRGREQERAYIEQAQRAMTPDCPGWSYLTARGFTDEEIRRFGFGYDPNPEHGWRDENDSWHKTPRIVIPWQGCDWYHTDRALPEQDRTPKKLKYYKPSSDEVGSQPAVYNPDALKGDHVFVVEGLLDALAIEAVGQPAIAIAGTSFDSTVDEIVGTGYEGVVIAMLDNDETGRRRNADLVAALEKEHVAVYAPDVTEQQCKDACEALATDRDALHDLTSRYAVEAGERAKEAAEERYRDAMSNMRAFDPAGVALGIYALTDEDVPVPTGIRGLDEALGGGLRRGVTVLGATSSMGKSTLALQVADNIAESGRSVLFVTVEQSARELVSKSITRIMRSKYGVTVATYDLLSRKHRSSWDERTKRAFNDALADYTDGAAQHLRIYEATRQPSVSEIDEVARYMAKHDGEPPVLFVDYLQLLAADDERDTDKVRVDKNMTALRQMARDLKTPVFVVSSVNRAAYSEAMSLDSYKESGGIEYSSDVLLGLQPWHMAEKLAKVSEAKRKFVGAQIVAETKAATVRGCEVVVLKHRNGALPPSGIPVTFYAEANLFRDGHVASKPDTAPKVI